MALQAEDQVSVYFNVNREYVLSDDAATVADAMGVDLDTLTAIVEGDQDWEPAEITVANLVDHGADVESEEWDVSEVTES